MSGTFVISEVNPNDTTGGGGCLGNGEQKGADCVGPFVIFHAIETDSIISPHAVLCSHCLKAAAKQIEDEPLRSGEDTITLADEEVVEVEKPESEYDELDDIPDI
jgi:hypothetical protein